MTTRPPFFSQSSKQALRNPWVLSWLAGLMLVLVINAAFIITAFVTSPGLVDEQFYEKGQTYEKNRLKLEAVKQELGWQPELKLPQQIVANSSAIIRLSLVDREGQPVAASRVTLTAYRPSDASQDFTREMVPIVGGLYQATLKLPLKGAWDLRFAMSDQQHTLELEERIEVAAP
ncbi:MAG: FixH family protein [Gammaproteobacteria bacterium]|nr:FixH family protein [Gammaproteobacteria bacterium]